MSSHHSLTLMTRYLGGSLAMRVKSLASSLKVGLMFSSIIQPKHNKKNTNFYYVSECICE